MNRSTLAGIGLAALLLLPGHAFQPQSGAAAGPATPRRSPAMPESMIDVLEQSQKSGKGVLVYMGSHAVGGAVVKVGEQTVELRSREYGRIVLRLDRIDGVAGN